MHFTVNLRLSPCLLYPGLRPLAGAGAVPPVLVRVRAARRSGPRGGGGRRQPQRGPEAARVPRQGHAQEEQGEGIESGEMIIFTSLCFTLHVGIIPVDGRSGVGR